MKKKNTLFYMLGYLGGKRISYAAGSILLGCYGLAENIFTGRIYATVTSLDQGMAVFARNMGMLLALMLCMVMVTWAGTSLYQRSVAWADMKVRKNLVAHIIRIPLSTWYQRHSAWWLNLLGKDTDDAAEAYKSQMQNLLGCLVQCIGGTVLLLFENASMAVFSLLVGALYFGVGVLKQKGMKQASGQKREASSKVASQVSELIEGGWVTRFYGIGTVLGERLSEAAGEAYRFGRRCASIGVINGALGQLGYLLAYGGSLVFGLCLVWQGYIGLPDMLSMWPVAVGVSYSLQKAGFFATSYQVTATAVERLRQAENIPLETTGGDADIRPCGDCIRLEDVCFSYDGHENVLSHVTLDIRRGEKIAFVGESGSGKSTLARLLMRFFDADQGSIQIYGRDIGSYSTAALRNCFSYVPQTSTLFSGSIEENLRMVAPDASEGELMQACRLAYADEFIRELPDGIHTAVGINGVDLSGGQKQRLAIARAFLHKADIFLFDEMAAALDRGSEEKINCAIGQICPPQTVLMVAHRLSAAKMADRVVVMDHGRICEVGSHEELMQKHGKYYELYRKQ